MAEETSHTLIQAGKELQAQARQGQPMTKQELEKIYQARRTELETSDLTEQARTQQLEELEQTFSIVKNLIDGIPQMQYSDELTAQMNAIINNTNIADELQQYVQVGNLQEVMWRLDEAGLQDEALRFEQVLQIGMIDDYSYSRYSYQWMIGSSIPTKLNNGMAIYPYGQLDNLIAYKLDKLFGTKVVPLTANISEVQLGGRHMPDSDNRTLHLERVLSLEVDHVKKLKRDKVEIIFANKYKAYLDFIGMEQVEPPPLTDGYLQRAQLMRYVTASGEVNGTYPLLGRALEFDIVSIPSYYRTESVMDVNKINFVEPEFIARLQKITLDDFDEVFLSRKYGPGYGSYDKQAREAYDRLQTYIQAAKNVAHNP